MQVGKFLQHGSKYIYQKFKKSIVSKPQQGSAGNGDPVMGLDMYSRRASFIPLRAPSNKFCLNTKHHLITEANITNEAATREDAAALDRHKVSNPLDSNGSTTRQDIGSTGVIKYFRNFMKAKSTTGQSINSTSQTKQPMAPDPTSGIFWNSVAPLPVGYFEDRGINVKETLSNVATNLITGLDSLTAFLSLNTEQSKSSQDIKLIIEKFTTAIDSFNTIKIRYALDKSIVQNFEDSVKNSNLALVSNTDASVSNTDILSYLNTLQSAANKFCAEIKQIMPREIREIMP